MFWNYLRQQVKNAVLGGVDDALDILDGDNRPEARDAAQLLRTRLKALPPPAPSTETNGDGRKRRGV